MKTEEEAFVEIVGETIVEIERETFLEVEEKNTKDRLRTVEIEE